MTNKIEPFDKFNSGMKRPDRTRHMELCGFRFVGERIADEWSPREIAAHYAKQFSEKNGVSAHVVYFLGKRNMDGERGYQFWIKEMR